MNEIKTPPTLGSREAAVRSIVNLISLATHIDEDKMAYWLDAYYQARKDYERDEEPEGVRLSVPPDPEIFGAMSQKLDAVVEQVKKSVDLVGSCFVQISGALAFATAPPRAPAPMEADEEDVTDNNVGNKTAEAEEPTPVMRSRETIKLLERVKSESRSEAARKQKSAERELKMRVADRLRELRAQGLKTGDIVRISDGKVTDSAVLSILDGQFRPIDDYRALDAALAKCAAEIEEGVTRT